MLNLTEFHWIMNKRFLFTKLKSVTLTFNFQVSDQKLQHTNLDLKNWKENQQSVQVHPKLKMNLMQDGQLNISEPLF